MEVEEVLEGKFKEARSKITEFCKISNEGRESTFRNKELDKDMIPKK